MNPDLDSDEEQNFKDKRNLVSPITMSSGKLFVAFELYLSKFNPKRK